MKAIIIALVALCSIEAHAFTTVTLKKDLELKVSESGNLVFKADEASSSGNDYCYLSILSRKNEDSTIIAKGTSFTVNEETNRCGQDWGKQCRLDLQASSKETEAELKLICKNRGFFAQKISAAKVNKILKSYVDVK